MTWPGIETQSSGLLANALTIMPISIYPICIISRVFTNGPGDRGSIPGQVIPKTQKMVLDTTLLNTQCYKVPIMGKWSNPGKGIAPFLTPRCSSYWKGSLWVTLNYSHHHTNIYMIRIFSLLINYLPWLFILGVCSNSSTWDVRLPNKGHLENKNKDNSL